MVEWPSRNTSAWLSFGSVKGPKNRVQKLLIAGIRARLLRGARSIPLTDRQNLDWMFTTNSFACYHHPALRSRAMDIELKIPRSIAYILLTPSNRWRSCVPNLRGAPGGQNRDIHLTFSEPRLQRSYQVSPRDITTEVLRHDYQASLCFAVLGN